MLWPPCSVVGGTSDLSAELARAFQPGDLPTVTTSNDGTVQLLTNNNSGDEVQLRHDGTITYVNGGDSPGIFSVGCSPGASSQPFKGLPTCVHAMHQHAACNLCTHQACNPVCMQPHAFVGGCMHGYSWQPRLHSCKKPVNRGSIKQMDFMLLMTGGPHGRASGEGQCLSL